MSRNLKATAVTTGLLVAAFALGLLGAMVKPETRIVGTIDGRRVDIPAWLQNEPEYDKKIKNAKVEQGWGGLRLVLWGLGLVPAGLALALSAERQGELEKERKQYDRECREEDAIGEVRSLYNVSLTKAVLQKKGEATIALVEDELEDEVDSIREANGWYAPDVQTPQKAIEPPLLRQPEGTQGNPFDGMKTPAQYAKELEDARQAAIARLGTEGGDGASVPAGGEPPAHPKFAEGEEVGKELMGSLASLKVSILSAGETGCGKTHTMDKWLRDIRAMFPKADIFAIAHKNDPFCGLMDEGRVRLFNPFAPEVALEYLDKVYATLQERLKTPKNKRAALYDDHPVRLILDDWFATYQALKGDPIWRSVHLKLASIITVGREVNVCLYVCTQSYNLEALGLADDGNIRSNLAITCQGFVKITKDAKTGREKKQGSFGALQQLLRNQSIVSDKEDRDRLITELRLMMVLSKKYQRPIIFSAIDEPMLGFVPHIVVEGLEDDDLDSTSTNVAIADRNDGKDGGDRDDDLPQISDAEARRWAMEFDLKSSNSESQSHSEQPRGDAQNNDSIGVSASEQAQSHSEQPESEQPIDPELVDWYRWLPSKTDVIKLLENNDAKMYNFPSFVRSKLKKTETSYNRKTKNAIVQLLLTLERFDLITKYQIDTTKYPIKEYPNE